MSKNKRGIKNIGELIPKHDCDFIEENGKITAHYFEKNPTFIERLFFKKYLKKPQKVELDEVGSFVWKNIDGNTSVNKISEKTKLHFGEDFEQPNQRVELFIQQMFRNKLILLFKKT